MSGPDRQPAEPDSPGVQVPPPFVYAAAFAAGYFLTRRFPVGSWPDAVPPFAGLVCMAMSLALAAWAMGRFFARRTAILPHRPASAMVESGPYRFTRNPMYVSLAVLYVGFATFLRSGWALLLLPAAIAAVDRWIIPREEAYLTRRFGEQYLAYKARVRRWI